MADYIDVLEALNKLARTLSAHGCLSPGGRALDQDVIRAMINMVKERDVVQEILVDYNRMKNRGYQSSIRDFILEILQAHFSDENCLDRFMKLVHSACRDFDNKQHQRQRYINALNQANRTMKTHGGIKKGQRVRLLDRVVRRDLLIQFSEEHEAVDVLEQYEQTGGKDVNGSLCQFILSILSQEVFAYDNPFVPLQQSSADVEAYEGNSECQIEREFENGSVG